MSCKNCKFNFDMLLISINGFDMKSFLILTLDMCYLTLSLQSTIHATHFLVDEHRSWQFDLIANMSF